MYPQTLLSLPDLVKPSKEQPCFFPLVSWEQFDSFIFISALKTLESFYNNIVLRCLDGHLKPQKDKRIYMSNSKSLRPRGILVFNIIKTLIFGFVLSLAKHYYYFYRETVNFRWPLSRQVNFSNFLVCTLQTFFCFFWTRHEYAWWCRTLSNSILVCFKCKLSKSRIEFKCQIAWKF